ncbi:marvel domain-containing protein [Hypoxylon fragiforme]|uniref:marvel domain-containing protein n=1 Tax=Hypoxylon fragiforme TaxID=63214 RepID=UPI0020C61C00|nr:marvel domain-containing protein [Hypoxylon fragiforme]KAI2612177.1 marvel domain-containing protein [Hypoxylon fragiforme]
MLKIATLAVRGFLLLFGAVVLGVSVTLAKHQSVGSPPSETSFGSFCGAFGILVSLVGFGALFVDKIPVMVMMAADGLAAAFYLAGGIALTIALKPVPSCTDTDDYSRYQRYTNKILNGGCQQVADINICPGGQDDDALRSLCQRTQADFVFEYLGFVFAVAVVALSFFLHRSGGGSRTTAYV